MVRKWKGDVIGSQRVDGKVIGGGERHACNSG